MSTIVLNVQGMHCAACVRHVTKALEEVAGVSAVAVQLEAERAVVEGSAEASALCKTPGTPPQWTNWPGLRELRFRQARPA